MADAARIWVVDDDRAVRSTIVRLLTRSGYQCFEADSGSAAIAILESSPIHLVISDLNMPSMSGVELLEVVRARWPEAT